MKVRIWLERTMKPSSDPKPAASARAGETPQDNAKILPPRGPVDVLVIDSAELPTPD